MVCELFHGGLLLRHDYGYVVVAMKGDAVHVLSQLLHPASLGSLILDILLKSLNISLQLHNWLNSLQSLTFLTHQLPKCRLRLHYLMNLLQRALSDCQMQILWLNPLVNHFHGILSHIMAKLQSILGDFTGFLSFRILLDALDDIMGDLFTEFCGIMSHVDSTVSVFFDA